MSCLLGGASPLSGELRAQRREWRRAGEERDDFLFTFFTAKSLKAFEVLSHTPSGMPAILLLRFLQWLRGKAFTYNSGDQGSIPRLGRSPREGMATHSSILAWRIPRTEDPERSMGSQRVGCD